MLAPTLDCVRLFGTAMAFCCELVSLLVPLLALLIRIAITNPSNVFESKYTTAAARYACATYNEVIAPAAVALGRDPVSHGLTNCPAFSTTLSKLRSFLPSPQLEFAFLKRAVKATIAHRFLKRAALDSRRENGRSVSNSDKHRLLHGLLAIDTVLQVTCESVNSSCALPVPSRTSRTRTRRDVPNNANAIPSGTADQPGDELDEHFDVFDENDYAESGQLKSAEYAEQRDDSDETEVKIGLILFHKPGGTHADALLRRGSFERRLARVRCIVLELEKQVAIASVTAGERSISIGQASGLLSFLMLLLITFSVHTSRG